jgi:hypothetical protein
MFQQWKVVTVTPSGRKDSLRILIRYLLRNRHVIDHHEFWLNTVNQDDIKYIYSVQRKYPDFFSIVLPKIPPLNPARTKGCPYSLSIHQFFEHCTDADTIYIRIDDDVCFFSNKAFDELLKFRVENKHYFIVYPFIINNSMNYLPELFKQIFMPLGHDLPKSLNRGRLDLDYLGSAELARDRHNDLLSNLSKLKLFEFERIETTDHMNINVICWFGYEFKKFDGRVQNLPEWNEGEEAWLATKKPKSLGMVNAICGKSLAAHLTFGDQRKDDARLLDKLVNRYTNLLVKIL